MFRFKAALVAVVAFCKLTTAEHDDTDPHHLEENCLKEISQKGRSFLE